VAAVHPGATAHGALLGRARLQPSDCVTIVGANGSIGMCMVQLAAAHAREVVAVIRNPAPAERLRQLGATHVTDADAEDAPHRAAAAASKGIDVFVDTTGQVGLVGNFGGADRLHGPDQVAAQREREVQLGAPPPRAHVGVHRVDRDRVHPDDDLAGRGDRIGQLSVMDLVGAAQRVDLGSSHESLCALAVTCLILTCGQELACARAGVVLERCKAGESFLGSSAVFDGRIAGTRARGGHRGSDDFAPRRRRENP
jgi:Zinc-binding dehydrogenase